MWEFRAGLGFRFSLAIIFLCVAAGPLPPADTRQPVPDAQARGQAAKLIGELFRADRAEIKGPAQEAVLAAKLLKSGIETNDDPTGRFELIDEARTSAAHAGDCETAMQAVAQLSRLYRLDGLSFAGQTLQLVVTNVRAQDAARVLPYLDNYVGQAISVDRYDLAKQGADLSTEAARKSHDGGLMTEAAAFVKEVDGLQAAFDGVPAAAAKLAQDPGDAAANLTVGKFYCLYKGDWAALVPLSRGNDPVLKDLAMRDLAGAKDAHAQMGLGDAWWNWAATQTGTPRQNCRMRAAFWYQQASRGLEGLSKLVVDHRLAELAAEHGQPVAPP